MSEVQFESFLVQVTDELDKRANQFVEEAAIEIEAQTKRTTPTTETQLKGSWMHTVDTDAHEAKVGSPLESSLWNEYGTGSYAENGNGRKGWWVYVDGNGRSATVSKTYPNETEAKKGAAFLRSQGLNAHPSNGKKPQKTFRSAYSAKKNKLILRAKTIFRKDSTT